jgi:CheY-like chemotaxis protein/CheY-specific phosphatase CheX
MHPDYMDDVIDVIRRTLNRMFKMTTYSWELKREESQVPPFEISGVLGFTGPVTGCLVVSFPVQLAHEMTIRTFNIPVDLLVTEDDMYDCVGEVANVIGGNLLPLFKGKSREGKARLSVPSVVVGSHRVVWRRKDTPYELVLFETDWGQFGAGFNLHEEDQTMHEGTSSYRLMIIDDSRVARRLLINAIEEADMDDCHIIEHSNAETALEYLEENDFETDLIFCDINMPGMEGTEFLRILADRGMIEKCPIIMVTGDVSEDQAEECKRIGARDLIEKPFTPDVIHKMISQVRMTV